MDAMSWPIIQHALTYLAESVTLISKAGVETSNEYTYVVRYPLNLTGRTSPAYTVLIV